MKKLTVFAACGLAGHRGSRDPERLETTLTKPPEIPGYELLEMLGEGGMGAVYRAVHLASGQIVAVKFLTTSGENRLLPGRQPIVNFERESRLMATLSHPNVIVIHESGTSDGRPYLVMEYVRGPSLRTLLQRGQPWPLRAAYSLLDQTAQALSYIHGQGILHLDLKPENVLLQHPDNGTPIEPSSLSSATCVPQKARPKITDFGLARPTGDAPMAEPLLAQGTIDYCAPELRHGLAVDVRSDLFALATLAYEVLTGRLPGRVFFPASQRNPDVPARVDSVLRRGLARDRDERYNCVEEFRTALLDALAVALSEPGPLPVTR